MRGKRPRTGLVLASLVAGLFGTLATPGLATPGLATPGLATPGLASGPASGPISGSDYVSRLETARQLAEADGAHPSPQGMQAVRQAVGLPLDVSLGTTVVHLPPDDTLAALTGTTARDFRQAGDHLGALEDSAKAALSSQPPDPQRLHAALVKAFVGITTNPGLIARLRHDLWLIILAIWQRLTRATRHIPLPYGVLVLIVLCLVVGLLVVLVVYRARYVVPERTNRSGQGSKDGRPDWERLASEALARGDLAGAVRARYGALLAALAAKGVVPDTPSLTAGETRRAVAGGLPSAYPVVAKATSIFEAVVYGRAPVTPGEVDTMAEAQRSVKAA